MRFGGVNSVYRKYSNLKYSIVKFCAQGLRELRVEVMGCEF